MADGGIISLAQTLTEKLQRYSSMEDPPPNASYVVPHVRSALRKLSKGTYGTCDTCGCAICPKRLAALPEAVHCIDCAA